MNINVRFSNCKKFDYFIALLLITAELACENRNQGILSVDETKIVAACAEYV